MRYCPFLLGSCWFNQAQVCLLYTVCSGWQRYWYAFHCTLLLQELSSHSSPPTERRLRRRGGSLWTHCYMTLMSRTLLLTVPLLTLTSTLVKLKWSCSFIQVKLDLDGFPCYFLLPLLQVICHEALMGNVFVSFRSEVLLKNKFAFLKWSLIVKSWYIRLKCWSDNGQVWSCNGQGWVLMVRSVGIGQNERENRSSV